MYRCWIPWTPISSNKSESSAPMKLRPGDLALSRLVTARAVMLSDWTVKVSRHCSSLLFHSRRPARMARASHVPWLPDVPSSNSRLAASKWSTGDAMAS